MHRSVYDYLGNLSNDVQIVDSLIVSSFLSVNDLKPSKNILLKNHLIDKESDNSLSIKLNELLRLIYKERETFLIEDLIEMFEFVISPAEKEVNGAVYTPKHIRNYIVDQSIYKLESEGINLADATFGDIACGCGGFFYTIAEKLHSTTGKTYFKIFRDNIFGLDIKKYSITRTKLLLSLLALKNGEDPKEFEWNLFDGDALIFDWYERSEKVKQLGGLHSIVGNPPYVGAAKLDDETKNNLKQWEVAKVGKADLYIPFFQIGLELLIEKGVLGYISLNSFYKSLNGIGLRRYFSEHEYDLEVIDFGGEQVFKGRTTYTCICLIQRNGTSKVKYTKTKSCSLSSLNDKWLVQINYSSLEDKQGWLLDKKETSSIIKKIESTGKPLSNEFEIRNGFATLRNNIYLLNPVSEDDSYYYLRNNDTEFKVEKGICKAAIKPNIIKDEKDIEDKKEMLLFPYRLIEKDTEPLFEAQDRLELNILEEGFFQENYPSAYAYLEYYKEELAKRDKGNKDYEKWYAFGRNQGLTLKGKKLLFPYISNKPYFVFTEDEELLFYNGFAVISHSEKKLRVVQKILNSRLFWFYLSHVSRPYENGYYSMGKRYLSKFGIYQFTEEEKKEILSLKNQDKIDSYLEDKYQIKIPKVSREN